VAQVVESLPSKVLANPSSAKKEEQQQQKKKLSMV
jgi:hypothetical protein